MVKIEGTLDEIRELLGSATRTVDNARSAVSSTKKAVKAAKKTGRKLSDWNRYIANEANHIKHKRGERKGRLNLKAMSAAFKRSKKK
jgi:hypothetical protein